MRIHLNKSRTRPGTRRKKKPPHEAEPTSINARLESARFGAIVDQTLESEDDSTSYARVDVRSLWLRQALRCLPEPEDCKIILMRFILGLTLKEITRQIGLPSHEVRDRYRRSLRLLDRELRGRF